MRSRMLGIAAVLAALAALPGCDVMQGNETTGQYDDDATISTKVRARLVEEEALKASDIHVTTMKNVVQLSGFVETGKLRRQAQQIAENVPGVKSVQNKLSVTNGGS